VNQEDKNGNILPPNELQMLKDRAKMMGIQFSGNIGLDALKAKVTARMEGEPDEAEVQTENVNENPFGSSVSNQPALDKMSEMPKPVVHMSKSMLNPLNGDRGGFTPGVKMSFREQQLKDAMRLVRCRIVNMDPKKKDLDGEILTVGNRYIGTVKKFIPYGEATDDGYHIPKVLYDELEDRKFLHIQVTKDKVTKMQKVVTSYVKEFSIEVLPQLTPTDLAKLAAAQAAAGNT
jgi:hypothetical protein